MQLGLLFSFDTYLFFGRFHCQKILDKFSVAQKCIWHEGQYFINICLMNLPKGVHSNLPRGLFYFKLRNAMQTREILFFFSLFFNLFSTRDLCFTIKNFLRSKEAIWKFISELKLVFFVLIHDFGNAFFWFFLDSNYLLMSILFVVLIR